MKKIIITADDFGMSNRSEIPYADAKKSIDYLLAHLIHWSFMDDIMSDICRIKEELKKVCDGVVSFWNESQINRKRHLLQYINSSIWSIYKNTLSTSNEIKDQIFYDYNCYTNNPISISLNNQRQITPKGRFSFPPWTKSRKEIIVNDQWAKNNILFFTPKWVLDYCKKNHIALLNFSTEVEATYFFKLLWSKYESLFPWLRKLSNWFNINTALLYPLIKKWFDDNNLPYCWYYQWYPTSLNPYKWKYLNIDETKRFYLGMQVGLKLVDLWINNKKKIWYIQYWGSSLIWAPLLQF